jgi:hypothetical protein
MAKRGGPVHVATTQRRRKGKVYTCHLLRRSFREDGKVKHETVGNLSHLPDHVIELVRRALRGESFVPSEEALEIQRSWPHGHVAAVLGMLRQLEGERLLASRRSRARDLVVAMVVARILDPRSKLATARGLDAATSLSEVLGLGDVEVDELYSAMDWLAQRQPAIERRLAARHLESGTLVFYDLTSTYFEGRHCPLARLGYSRDRKRNRLQIEFGVLVDRQGRPIAVEVFAGNVGDPSTLASQIHKLQQRFKLERLIIVGDRGMITNARIREDLRPHDLQWITSLRAPAIRKLLEGEAIQPSLFDEQDLAEITDPAYPEERLIVCRNPLLVEERRRKREELLAATERELDKIVAATQRRRRPLRGQDAIGVRVGRVLGRFKMAKHFRIEIEETTFRYERVSERIAAEAALDGLYVIRTNVPAPALSGEQAVQAYKDLSRTERAFRCLKTVDLKVRPIYHHLEQRVRAHVFLCMLAYYVEWHLRQALAPLLFDDEDPEAGRARRRSVVAPAQRSASAEAKAHTQRTSAGQTVHSFATLLAHLATLSRHRVRLKIEGEATFIQYTQPTPLQEQAFDLLGVPFRM